VHGRWIAEDLPLKRTAETLYLHIQELTPHIVSTEAETEAEILTTKPNTVVGTTKREWLDALPIEQSYDDERSLTFDGETLAADVEIMGNPTTHLRIAANQTVAHVAVRLCEVTADGKSWLVSYGLKNLTHRHSDDEPEAIVPGEFFDLDLQLHSIAHRFSKGCRIRVALSESLWPLVWPSPGSAQISLRTGLSNISLPLRQIEATQTALPMATINTPASPPFTYQPGRPDTDDQIRITHESNPSAVREAEVNTLQLRHAESEVSIKQGEPESCIWRESTRREWQRGAWHCAIEADYQLSASQQNFILQENLRAYKDDELVFEHSSEQEIPRHFL
jgi:predicted acyl esterase